MSETIEATFPPETEPAFPTAEEAIAFSKSIDRARRSNELSSCIGRIIVSVEWSRDEFRLHLDSGKILHVGCLLNAVDLTIEDDVPTNTPRGLQTPDIVLLRLEGKEINWNRGKLMEVLRGKGIRRIQMSQTGLFLYVESVGILTTNILIDRLSGRPFLFWELTD